MAQFTDRSEMLERIGKVLEAKERPLTRTEQLLSNNIRTRLLAGDAKSVVEALATLNENPALVQRVLKNLQQEFQGPGQAFRWETGTDSDGNSFTRLRLEQHLRTGSTIVTIGSDGLQSATTSHFRVPGGDRPISADEGLQILYPPPARKYIPAEHQGP
jgi:hypothetical protein